MVRHQCRYVAFRDIYNIHSFHSQVNYPHPKGCELAAASLSISLQVKNRHVKILKIHKIYKNLSFSLKNGHIVYFSSDERAQT